jgi:glycyl-tRNA synthetase beta chain
MRAVKKYRDFLLEIFTEELPPKRLQILSQALTDGIQEGLNETELCYDYLRSFATPRRIAVLVQKLEFAQPDQRIERQGPSLDSAFDKNGKATRACLGFTDSCGVSVEQLERRKTDRGVYLVSSKVEKGKDVFELMPQIVRQSISKLPVAKPMRWGDGSILFVRPVHSVMMLYGNQVIPSKILGLEANNKTFGHRFHCKGKLTIKVPKDYSNVLKKKGFVISDFNDRKETIRKQLFSISEQVDAQIYIEEELLDEVTSIVEWPHALLATFPESFLEVPKEAIISFIQNHQRCFPLFDQAKNLKPYFITVSNIESKKPQEVIKGNERVMHARLSDAKFFYETDLKIPLENRVIGLKNIVFQAKLGSLFDKVQRVIRLTHHVAQSIKANVMNAERAAFLSKSDLLTEMVSEFPELQGIMGQYYALHNNEDKSVAIALNEQYMPRHGGDSLPSTKEGQALAIADRTDTLVGIFGINKKPTGDKDPFGLRRAAIGMIRIITESNEPLQINLLNLLSQSKELYAEKIINTKVIEEVFQFIMERFKSFLVDLGFSVDEFNAVSTNGISYLSDFMDRMKAVKEFRQLPEAADLAVANKRVTNLLVKESVSLIYRPVDQNLLQEPAEIRLAKLVEEKTEQTKQFYQLKDYSGLLKDLVVLCEPIHQFFDQVMVMVDDEKIRLNRLTLLAKIKGLFLQVADISVLQKTELL